MGRQYSIVVDRLRPMNQYAAAQPRLWAELVDAEQRETFGYRHASATAARACRYSPSATAADASVDDPKRGRDLNVLEYPRRKTWGVRSQCKCGEGSPMSEISFLVQPCHNGCAVLVGVALE